ncbi:nucleotide sugar dehydrogenase [Oscillatoria laete-virens NRMC-F 0139]|nr:nucleotide sugar dehydrogenase [Oscillatoria laete-virens]MDL5054580.1 nucleotide sugar dehydrogenase [Oscillatoria laete-virens NRMC-F 0139]
MTPHQQLLERLNERSATVGIVGLGYVGLPLAVEFAEVGYTVIGVDVSEHKVALLNRGESYIPDIPTARLAPLVQSGRLSASTHYSALRAADAVSICVPTPLRKTKDPDMSFVIDAVNSVAEYAHPGMLIVLESTTYPGTTEEIMVPKLESKGFTIGEDIFVAFSPERIDPGNQKFGVRNTPKVVGGYTPACKDAVSALYRAAVDTIVPVSSPTTAEMVKLLENTFRAVNIGLVNEMALMCDKLNIDVWEVIHAAASKPFGFMPFYPGPGLGGHCIPVDPHYLSWKLKALNYTARFIELASEINTNMPVYVTEKVALALNDDARPVRGSRIVVLGVAYKKDIDDVRESPALDVINLLLERGADVCYHDPHVPSIRLEDERIASIHGHPTMQSTPYSTELLANADCVVIVTDHSSFNWHDILEHSKLVVDTRNAVASTRSQNGSKARVVTL